MPQLHEWQKQLLTYDPQDEKFPNPPCPSEIPDRTRDWIVFQQAPYIAAKLPTVMGCCTLALAELHLNDDPAAAAKHWSRARNLTDYHTAAANEISRRWIREFLERGSFPLAWRTLREVVRIMPGEPFRTQGDTAYLAHQLAIADDVHEDVAPTFRSDAVVIWVHALRMKEEIDLELFLTCGGKVPQPSVREIHTVRATGNQL